MTPTAARSSISGTLLLAALGLLLVTALDPKRDGLLGPGLALLALSALAAPDRRTIRSAVLGGLVLAAFAAARPDFRADSPAYYVWLRSAVWDGDLDFRNEWDHWGFVRNPDTRTGLMESSHPVGPALAWAPFVGYARLYVLADRALLGGRWDDEGYGTPYLRAAGLGTLAFVALACFALFQTLQRILSRRVALVALLGTLAASPLVYYAFVVPTMAHALAFAMAALLLAALHRATRVPSKEAWIVLGALTGLVTLMRWQAAVMALCSLPLFVREWREGRMRWSWIAGALAAGTLAFAPQMLAWKLLFGSFLELPQGSGFFDWSSPRLLDVLFSSQHGLLTWSPAVALGLLGLLPLALRESTRPLALGGLLSFAATAWVNGSVVDWTGSDAFGHRRFDLAWPFAALGMAALVASAESAVKRQPILAPAGVLALFALWNAGLVTHFRNRLYPGEAPLERLATDQARLVKRVAEGAAGALFGEPGRAFVYKVLVGEYLYSGYNPVGTLDLAELPPSEIRGFSKRRADEGRIFRWALPPESCVRAPIDERFDFVATVTARAPRKTLPQTLSLFVNDRLAAQAPLTHEWQDVDLQVAPELLHPGENWLCFRFANHTPSGDGEGVGAALSRIQLP